MAFIINLKPIKIEKLKKKLQQIRNKQSKEIKIKKYLENRINNNPIKSNQFNID